MIRLGILGLGLMLLSLGLYLAPTEARRLRAPFVERGQPEKAVVASKATVKKSYVAGGRRARVATFQERTVTVRLPREADRQVTIEDLVLPRDFDALTAGSEVSITHLSGGPGPYYLLTSSVQAGFFPLLGWAFSGRPAYGGAIATAIPGAILTLLGGVLLVEARRRRAKR